MDHPFRSGPGEAPVEAPRDAGIVGQIIDQFADPLAFYRELVQNAIDAGTSAVHVTIAHDREARLTRVSVRDDGEGMTRQVVEKQLLVLFRSTKERDETKIGKFGIGFASVLAPGPSLVAVETARDGRRLAVHLRRDLTFELFDVGPATRAGTTVRLELPMEAADVAPFVERSRAALVRWCRHAAVPIHLAADDAGPERAERIDRPLGLEDALVEVSGASADGRTRAIVGILASGASYAGFFDSGLTLHESDEPLAGRLAFKVQDARLAHTLSRDNVRRDAAFARCVEFVRALAARALPGAAVAAIEAAAAGRDGRRYRALVDAVEASPVPLADAWRLPLLERLGEQRVAPANGLPRQVWCASRRSATTAVLAAAGHPVVDLAIADPLWLAPKLAAVGRRRLAAVERELTRVAPVAVTATDQLLLAALLDHLAAAHRRPGEVVIADVAGGLDHVPALTSEPGAVVAAEGDGRLDPWVLDTGRGIRSPFTLLFRPTLVLHAGHPLIAAARREAVDDPAAAAALLARALLVRFGRLDEKRSAALLERTLDGLALDGAAEDEA